MFFAYKTDEKNTMNDLQLNFILNSFLRNVTNKFILRMCRLQFYTSWMSSALLSTPLTPLWNTPSQLFGSMSSFWNCSSTVSLCMMHMLWSIHVDSISFQIKTVFLTGISLRIMNLLFIIPKALSTVCLALDSFLLNQIVCGDRFP